MDAVVLRDDDELTVARDRLVAAVSDVSAARACAVIANFELMNRLLDGIGAEPMASTVELAPEIGVTWTKTATSPTPGGAN